jgi:MinD-like ATPase involved in chromosome partitioning or flagellar assembly
MSASGNGPVAIEVTPGPQKTETIVPGGHVETKKKVVVRTPLETTLPPWVLDSKPQDVLQLVLWWFYTRLGLYKKEKLNPPLMNSPFTVGLTIRRVKKSINKLRHVATAIIVVLTKKGGVGKTTISTWIGAVLMDAYLFQVGIFDADRGGGLVANRFGLNVDDALTTDALVRYVNDNNDLTYDDLIKFTVSDEETGVLVFHGLPARDIGGDRFTKTVNVLKTGLAGLIIDTAPGFRVPATNAAARVGNVHLVVGYGISQESIELGVKETIDYAPYELGDRLNQVVVVIIGMPLRQCNKRTAYNVAKRCGVAPDRVLFIPYEKYMDDRIVKNLKQVRLRAIKPRTLLAFEELGLKVCQVAAGGKEVLPSSEDDSTQHTTAP